LIESFGDATGMRNFEASRKVLTYRSGRKNRFCEEEIVHLNTTCDGFVGELEAGFLDRIRREINIATVEKTYTTFN